MTKKKTTVILTLVVFAASAVYASYALYVEYRDQRSVGYKSTNNLANPTFTVGQWKGVLIDDDIKNTDGAHNIVPYDIDKDGEIELIANSYRSDSLMFYKYHGDPTNPRNWSKYVIDSSVGGGIPIKPILQFIKSTISVKLLGGFTRGAHYTAIADLNNDGRDDLIVAGDRKEYDIVWYEAPENIADISAWRKHILYQNNLHKTYHIEIGDIDDDGDQDVVFVTKQDKGVGWLENNGSLTNWPMTWIDRNVTLAFNVRVADLNRDGRNDVIASEDDAANGGILHFYSYSGDPGIRKNWAEFSLASFPEGEGLNVFEIADIDSDGNSDVVTGNHQGDVFVLENPYPDNVNQEWNRYKVNNSYASREIDVGDIDSDGDLDIIVADYIKDRIVWFENNGLSFYDGWRARAHIIDQSEDYLNWAHHVELADIDGDGNLDAVVAAAGSNMFLCYFRNH